MRIYKARLANIYLAETLSPNKTHLMTQYLSIKNMMLTRLSSTIDVITYSPKGLTGYVTLLMTSQYYLVSSTVQQLIALLK
jgi:hypothetical protein